MEFQDWLKQTGKSKKTAKNYSNAIHGSISDWAESYGITTQNLSDIRNHSKFLQVSLEIQNNDDFTRKNTKGNGMYSAALNHYAHYLSDISSEEIREDIDEILDDQNIPETEKSTLVSARVGQGKYRKSVIDCWGGCALTGFPDTRFLVASHIKPWKQSNNAERLDPYDGLLLLPNIDKVFDLGFITFQDDGELTISSHLEKPDVIGVSLGMTLALDGRHLDYMSYHREHVYEKKI